MKIGWYFVAFIVYLVDVCLNTYIIRKTYILIGSLNFISANVLTAIAERNSDVCHIQTSNGKCVCVYM